MSKSSRFHRHPERLGWLDRGGKREDQIEKRWPGNKAWAQLLASVVASLIVAGLKILKSYLKFVFVMLENRLAGLVVLVIAHVTFVVFVLSKLF